MDFDDIERIWSWCKQHDLAEFELERDGLKLGSAKRPPGLRRMAARCQMAQAPRLRRCRPPSAPVPAALAATHPAPATSRHWSSRSSSRRSSARSTGRRSRAPRRSSKSAQRVKKDQVLCIIEAMKLMNEITSEYDGEIVSAYVENGKPVQYGERLFAIKTVLTGT